MKKKKWKAHKATVRQFKFVIFRKAKPGQHKHLGWLTPLPENWDPAGPSVRDGSQFILMLWNIKAKCTFNGSKKFCAAQGLQANNLDHNKALLLNSCSLHFRQQSTLRVILYWFYSVCSESLWMPSKDSVPQESPVQNSRCCVFHCLKYINDTVCEEPAHPIEIQCWRVWALTWTIHTSDAPRGAFMHIYSRQGRGHAALLAAH